MSSVKDDKAECCQYSNESAEYPEQAWVGTVKEQACEVGTDREGDAPRKPGNCHVASTHVLGRKAGHQ